MDNASRIKQLLQQITGTDQSVFLFRPMEVVSVEGDTCRAPHNGLEIRTSAWRPLKAVRPAACCWKKPAVGSIVLRPTFRELRECAVVGYSE